MVSGLPQRCEGAVLLEWIGSYESEHIRIRLFDPYTADTGTPSVRNIDFAFKNEL